jgi:hypothetical protein
MIYPLFERLLHFGEGDYLLSHKTGENNVVISKATEKQQQINAEAIEAQKKQQQNLSKYDLHTAHKFSPLLDTETFAWRKPRWHFKGEQIPETFPVLPNFSGQNVNQVVANLLKKKQPKGNKKKKKGKNHNNNNNNSTYINGVNHNNFNPSGKVLSDISFIQDNLF